MSIDTPNQPDDNEDEDTDVEMSDLPERTQEHLRREYGVSQDRRVCGYFHSQSLRKILQHINAEDIIEVVGRRRVTSTSNELPNLGRGGYLDYTTLTDKRKLAVDLAYDRTECGRVFDAEGILELLDEEGSLYDIPVQKLVFRFENDQLHDQLTELLCDVANYDSLGVFEQPFHAVMHGRAPGTRGAERQVRDYHNPRYFEKDGDGLGWQVRTLDLTAIWSLNAWTCREVIGTDNDEKVTLHDLEDHAINHVADETPVFGAINTKLLVNKWRQKFSRGVTDTKSWEWDETGGWVRVGGDDE